MKASRLIASPSSEARRWTRATPASNTRFTSPLNDFQWSVRVPVPYLLPEKTPGPAAYTMPANRSPAWRSHAVQVRRDRCYDTLSSPIDLRDLHVFPHARPMTIGSKHAPPYPEHENTPEPQLSPPPSLTAPPIKIGWRTIEPERPIVPGPVRRIR
jgi:hypothetical protein